jgi:hypothetical protein
MNRMELTSKMHRAGLRLDDAATAAAVAFQAMRRERDALMVRAVVECGMSVRLVGAILGVTHARVVQVVNAARRDLPANTLTLQTPEKESQA